MSPQRAAGRVPVIMIMCSAAFSDGVEDVRAGRPPRYDDYDDDNLFAYERGRHWAVLAPPDLPLFNGSRINKKALKIFDIVDGII
jgi:hypothetical protein